MLDAAGGGILAGSVVEAREGDFVFGPGDIPHRYSTGPDGCRMLVDYGART
jgi:hypothetical protein